MNSTIQYNARKKKMLSLQYLKYSVCQLYVTVIFVLVGITSLIFDQCHIIKTGSDKEMNQYPGI